MSSGSERDLSCPVCHEVFTDPVLLLCSHSFCRVCVQTWWSEKPAQRCPVCKEVSVVREPPSNLVLKNVCEAFLEQRGRREERLCRLHPEELKLFCLDHQEPVCLLCRDSANHRGHSFRPLEEEAREQREKLQENLKALKEQLEVLEEVEEEFHQTLEFIRVQAEDTEQAIREQFRTLRRFLEEEEEERLSFLREEEQRKRRLMEEKLEALRRDMAALSETILSCEEEESDPVSFLQSCKAAVQSVQRCPLLEELSLPPHTLIDQAQHLANLAFNIWNRMKDAAAVCYTPLVLDPNTAHPELVLSPDLSAVTRAERQDVPRNPERFQFHGVVLGARGLDSGAHSWTLEVEDDPSWDVGVLEESVDRKTEMLGGFWRIGLNEGRYTASAPPLPDQLLSVTTPLRRLAVLLDWDRGTLDFYDSDTHTHIHSFKHRFTQKLFPFIYTENTVRVLAQDVSGSDDEETG